MPDTTTATNATPDLQAVLQQLMAQYQPQSPATGWGQPVAAPQVQAVHVPLRVPLPNGSEIRLYVQLPGEVLASPQTLLAALQMLMQQGLPLDVWAPKGDGWGHRGDWGNRFGGGRSGWSKRRW
jgi:hypothetical protein